MKSEVRKFFKEEYYQGKLKDISKIKFTFSEMIDFTHTYNEYKNKFDVKIEAINYKTDLYIIHKAICMFFKCDLITPFNRSRKTPSIKTRQWFHYMSRYLNPEYEVSLRHIGNYYSDVTKKPYDHASVLNSVKKITGYIERYAEDYKIRTELESLINELKQKEINKLELDRLKSLETPITMLQKSEETLLIM